MRLARGRVTLDVFRAPLVAAAVVAAIAAVLSRIAYFWMFSGFASYDDEGYVMQTIRSYLSGAPLYDAVFSQYGPAFYVYAWFMHGLLRIPLTHDAVRLMTIGVWLAGTALGAIAVFRFTRSVIVTAFGSVVLFFQLRTLINEPGHPQAVLVLVVLGCVAIASRTDRPMDARRAAICGALTAFATLVKINVGAYLGLGLLVSLVLASPLPLAVRAVVATAAALVPFVILRPVLGAFGAIYATVVATAVSTVSLTALRESRPSLPNLRPLVAFSVSGAIAGVVLLVPAIAGGTTVTALLHAMITEPQRLVYVFLVPLGIDPRAWTICAASAAGCTTWALSNRVRRSPVTDAIVVCAKIGGAWLLVTEGGYAGFFVYLTPLLWLARIVPRTPEGSSDTSAPGRTTVALVAAFQTLQAYPVAGSQIGFATAVTVVLAIVGLGDVFDAITRARLSWMAVALRLAVVAIALQIARPVYGLGLRQPRYLAGYALRLPGATRLRLHAHDVATFQWLSATATASCGRLQTLPGLYSFNAWSGVPPPSDDNVTAWHVLLPEPAQARIWAALDASPRPCVIVYPAMVTGWARGRPVDELNAGQHLRGRHLLAEAEGFEFLTAASADDDAPVELVQGRQSFAPDLTALPLDAALLRPGARFTLRVWFRTSHAGVVLSCQDGESLRKPSPTFPLVYVGRDGALQSAELPPNVTLPNVADGRWHSVALVHDGNTRRIYLDGASAGVASGLHRDDESARTCQAGNGFAERWPDASDGWMPLTGDIAAVGVARTPWTDAQIAADRERIHFD